MTFLVSHIFKTHVYLLILVVRSSNIDDEVSEENSQVKKMKPHVPGIVTFADHNRPLPWTVTYHAVVMFADISGKLVYNFSYSFRERRSL